MRRRDFLKRLGAAMGVAAVLPVALSQVSQPQVSQSTKFMLTYGGISIAVANVKFTFHDGYSINVTCTGET